MIAPCAIQHYIFIPSLSALFLLSDSYAVNLQFIMFYACSLDPEICGLEFALFLSDIFIKKEEDSISRYFFPISCIQLTYIPCISLSCELVIIVGIGC